MIKAQEKLHNESSTATFVSSVAGIDGVFDKSIRIEKEPEKVHDELFNEDQYRERSESFKRFLQHQVL